MKKSYLLMMTLTIFVFVQGQYTWIAKNAFPGAPRGVAATFNVNNTGYIVGGFTQYPGTWVDEVWAYNPSNDSWTQKNNYPNATAGSPVFSIGDSSYVVGGYIGGGHNNNLTYLYDPANDSWTPKASFPEGGISGAFSFVINGTGYVGSGERPGANNSTSTYAYNPSSDSWSPVAAYPESLVNTVGFAIDSLGYAGLGSNGSYSQTSDFYSYSPSTNTWTPIASFPGEPRNCAMAFVLNGKAYVGGGWTVVPGSSNVIYDLSNFYCYDPSTNTWSEVPGLPDRAREHANTFVLGDNAYLVGGYDDYISGPVSTVSEFGTCSSLSSILPIPGGNTKSGIEVYPNPTGTGVNVKIDNAVNNELNYEVVSVDGKVVKTGVTRQSTFGFNAGNLADGIYILTIRNGQQLQGEQKFEVIH